ncbi:MAG: TlpA disulfide reductase family protein [Planctomycetota bacterium]
MLLLRIAASALCLGLSLTAQTSFSDLYREVLSERRELMRSSPERPTPAKVQELDRRHADRIEKWLERGPNGGDAANGRFLLVSIYQRLGQDEEAETTLTDLDVARTPPFELLVAARQAERLGLDDKREAWITEAIERPAPFEERARVATYLMTVLVEIDRGEAIFTSEFEKARDDEERARVRYYRCAAIREREDLPEGSYDTALEELGETYPDTYWGGIAKDRVRALGFQPGDPAILFESSTLDGETFRLADQAGRHVLLEFWSEHDETDQAVVRRLRAIREQFAESGLQVVSVQLEKDEKTARESTRASGRTWPQVWDGRGWETDVALRYAIEQVPFYILIDGEGRIVTTRIYLQDEAGAADLRRLLDERL